MRNMIPNRKEKGFTLIELVMVIVILGILAAFALPRFADFGGEARAASVQALGGAMKSASSIARARLLANGGASATPVVLEGQTIAMVAGYPAASTEGILRAAQVDATLNTAEGGDYEYAIATDSGKVMTLVPKGFSGNDCKVEYKEAIAATTSPVVKASPSNVTVTTSGCDA